MRDGPWRLIRSGYLSGGENMAVDEALLEAVAAGRSRPVLRLYRWAPATVSLGYAQRGVGIVNLAACRDLGLDVVRRCTGGRAVLHDREMTYAVIAPERSAPFPGGILENYRVIAEVLQLTLASLGLPALLAPGRRRGAGGEGAEYSACFTAPSHYELVVQGCKVTGCAQRRFGAAFLQHGSIPLEMDAQRLFRALDTHGRVAPAAGGRRLERSIGWLNRWLARPVSIEEVEDLFLGVCARAWGVRFVAEGLSAAERRRVDDLVREKYGDPAWNLRGLA